MNLTDLLIGLAIGDAYGAGVEFQDRDWIRANVDFTSFVNARDTIKVSEENRKAFTHNYHPWDYTDDTEMTIGLIKALLSDEPFSANLLIQKWEEEYQKGVKEKGYGRNGHGSMSWYYNGEKTIEQIRAFQKDRKNPGNAPAMRSVPLGLIESEWINKYAEINANATHPNINAIISSQCIARAAEFIIIKKGDSQNLITYCMEHIQLNEEYQQYLTQVDQLGKYDDLKASDFEILCGPQPIQEPYFLAGIKGVPSDSKYTAGCVLFVLKNSENALDALKKSVNLGGDVDSIASITMGIVSARYGIDSLPKFMLDNIEGKGYLMQIANRFESKIDYHEK